MSDESIIHVLDRVVAVPAAVIELARIAAYISNKVSPLIIGMTLVVQLAAFFCFLQSAKAQAELNRDNFVLWHYLWHCYPLTASLVIATDSYQRKFRIRHFTPKVVEPKFD